MKGRRLAGTIGLFLAGFAVAWAHFFVVLTVFYPHQLDFGEAFVASEALTWKRGQIPYTPLFQPPYLVTNYPPLFPWIAGLGTASVPFSFSGGRFLSWMALLGIGVIIGLTGTKGEGGSPSWPWLPAALFLIHPVSCRFGALYRVDTLAAFLEALGVWWWVKRKNRRGRTLTGLWFGLALLTKQTSLAGPLAVAVSTLMGPGRRSQATLALAWTLASAGGVTLALFTLSNGLVWDHWFRANINPWHWQGTAQALLDMAPLVLLGLAAWGPAVRRLNTPGHLFLVYAVLSTVLQTLFNGKFGSWDAYRLAPMAAWCMVLAAVPKEVLWEKNIRRIRWAVMMAAAAGLAAWSCQVQWERRNLPAVLAQGEGAWKEAVAKARSVPGPMLCADGGLALEAGKPLVYHPFVMTQLALAGKWDETPFLMEMASGKFPLVQWNGTHGGLFTARQREVVAQFFEPQEKWIIPTTLQEHHWQLYHYKGNK